MVNNIDLSASELLGNLANVTGKQPAVLITGLNPVVREEEQSLAFDVSHRFERHDEAIVDPSKQSTRSRSDVVATLYKAQWVLNFSLRIHRRPDPLVRLAREPEVEI